MLNNILQTKSQVQHNVIPQAPNLINSGKIIKK